MTTWAGPATGTYSCPCCGIPTPGTREQAEARVTCKPCQSHGHNAISKDQTHREQWSSTLRRLQSSERAAHAEVRRAQAEAKGLRDGLLERYDSGDFLALKELLSTEAVARAEDEKRAAYDRDAESMSILLLDVAPRHRGQKGGSCTCGLPTSSCVEWQAVEPMRDHLDAWEHLQLRRMREHKPFGLPMRHASVKAEFEREPRREFNGLDEARIRYGRPKRAGR